MQASVLHPWVDSQSCLWPTVLACIAFLLRSRNLETASLAGECAASWRYNRAELNRCSYASQSTGIVCYERKEDVANAQRQTDGMHFGGRRLTVK